MANFPDGAAVDTDGGYWTALIGASEIIRFTPDGRRDRCIAAPTRFPTMVAFGGDAGQTMFVTSSAKYLGRLDSAAQEVERGIAGSVFACAIDVRGLPEPELLPGAGQL